MNARVLFEAFPPRDVQDVLLGMASAKWTYEGEQILSSCLHACGPRTATGLAYLILFSHSSSAASASPELNIFMLSSWCQQPLTQTSFKIFPISDELPSLRLHRSSCASRPRAKSERSTLGAEP